MIANSVDEQQSTEIHCFHSSNDGMISDPVEEQQNPLIQDFLCSSEAQICGEENNASRGDEQQILEIPPK